MEPDELTVRIRRVIGEHGRTGKDADLLPAEADLYQMGMTSHASVNVMLALEGEFGVEFPDQMLTRSIFSSIATIRTALEQLTAA